MSRFRIRGQKLFLTYPQCNVSKEEAYAYLTERFNAKELLVAHELHANGDDHLHCYIELLEPGTFNDPSFADMLGFHGNYQSCRSAKNVLKYCTKKDDYMATFDVESVLKGRSIEKTVLGKRILEGAKLTDIVQEFPQLVFGYKRLKEDVALIQADLLKDERDDLPAELPNPWGFKMPVDTDNKQCHFWVWSRVPNRGKTTGFLNPIHEKFKSYWKDQTQPYYDIRRDTELIIFDEVRKGQFKSSELNMICDGHKEYRIFQGGNIRLLNKPLVVIASNFPINEVFPFDFALVQARFIEYEIA